MDKIEKLREAKLMVVENILSEIYCDSFSAYDYAVRILEAIREVEIKQELLDHEASLETNEPHSIDEGNRQE